MMMNRIKNIHSHLPLALFVFILLGLGLLPFFQHQINPDGVSYITSATKYLHGDWRNAISGNWPPLITWLLLPFLALGMPGPLSFLLILIASGALMLVLIMRYSFSFEMNHRMRTMLLWTLIPLILYFCLSGLTPDVPLITLFFAYFILILSPNYIHRPWIAAACGLLGALAYFAKSVGLPLWILHFAVTTSILWIRHPLANERRLLLKNATISYVVFFAIASLWIIPVSLKFHHFTTGFTGKYNLYLSGPQALGHPQGHPIHTQGFLAPPNSAESVSAWDDPQAQIRYLPPWNPFASQKDIGHLYQLIIKNIFATLGYLHAMTVLALPILLIFGIQGAYFTYQRRANLLTPYWFPVLTLGIIISSYLPMHVEERFLWIIYIFMLLILAQQLTQLNQWMATRKKTLPTWIIVIAALTFLGIPQNRLIHRDGVRDDIVQLSNQLKTYPIHGNVASNIQWHTMLYLSYYRHFYYYGTPKTGISDSELQKELKKFQIHYFFWWDSTPVPEFLKNASEVTQGKTKGFKVFNLK